MKRLAAFLALLLSASCVLAADKYVSPGGSGSTCSLATPCPIQTGIGNAVSGETVWLRGGTHLTPAGAQFVPAAGVTVRSYPGEWAKVDGKGGSITETFKIVNSNVTLRDFEIFNSLTPRVPYNRASGVAVQSGSNVQLINLVIHDTGQGIFAASVTPNLLIYGCLIYNAGTGSLDHSLYAQNSTGSTNKYWMNVLLRSASFAFHGFGSSALVNDMDIWRSVCADAGGIRQGGSATYRVPCWFAGGPAPNPVTRVAFREALVYQKPATRATGSVAYGFGLNYGNQNYGIVSVTDGYAVGGWRIAGFQDTQTLTVTGNTFVTDSGQIIEVDAGGKSGWTINNNTYWTDTITNAFSVGAKDGAGTRTGFTLWKSSTGYDASSTSNMGKPTAAKVFAWPNSYEAGRGLVTVYNWPMGSTLAVDLSPVLSVGASYEVIDNQNWRTVVKSGVYAGGTVVLPMTGTAATPVGLANPGHLGPFFNTFTVVTTAGGGPTPSPTQTASPTAQPPSATPTLTRTRTPMPTTTATPVPPTATNTRTPTPTVTPSPASICATPTPPCVWVTVTPSAP